MGRAVVKLGSSIVADEGGVLRADVLDRVCGAVADHHEAGNDFLAAQLAILIGAEHLILLTDIDGLYTADPRTDPGAELVGEVTDFEGLTSFDIAATTSPLGSGGMRSKVVAAEMSTAAGIPATICNGLSETALTAALAGEQVG